MKSNRLSPASGYYEAQPTLELIQMMGTENNDKAFETLFHRFYPLLCERVYHMVGCAHRSEEIVSDVFIKIWRNRKHISISSNPKSYLYTAVRNQSIDYLRKQAKRREATHELEKKKDPPTHQSPEEEILYEEFSGHVQAAIDALPPKGQHIFRLSREEGLKYREIAQQLNISIKTVETHMRRSLIALRQALEIGS
jgi:RNA polymerase sigma-70 factor (family 1)